MQPTLKDTSLPSALRSDEPCVPFKVGEPRLAKAYTPSPDAPHFELKDTQVMLVDSSPSRSVFSWKGAVTNNSLERLTVVGTLALVDCAGFKLSEKKYDAVLILPGQTASVGGEQQVTGAAAQAVRRFHLGVGSVEPRAQNISPPVVALERQPRLRVVWSRLDEIDSQVQLYGEVFNAGNATARSVQVLFTVKTKEGVTMVSGRAPTLPADLQPGQTTTFKTRIAALSRLSGQQAFLDLAYSSE